MFNLEYIFHISEGGTIKCFFFFNFI